MTRDPLEALRALAKTDYYQSLYSCAKDLGLKLFENDTNLTKIQLWFLSFVSMYSSINMDITLGECSNRVLENNIYEDAYLYYKRKSSKRNKKKQVVTKPPTGKDEVLTPKSSWMFKRKVKHGGN